MAVSPPTEKSELQSTLLALPGVGEHALAVGQHHWTSEVDSVQGTHSGLRDHDAINDDRWLGLGKGLRVVR